MTVEDISSCGSWKTCSACGHEFKFEGWEAIELVMPGRFAVGSADFRTGRIPVFRALLCGTCAPTELRARDLAGDALTYLREQRGRFRGWWRWRQLGRPATLADYRRVLGVDPLSGWPGLPLPILPPAFDKAGHNDRPATPRPESEPSGQGENLWGRGFQEDSGGRYLSGTGEPLEIGALAADAVLDSVLVRPGSIAETEAPWRDPAPSQKIEDLHHLSPRTANAIRRAGIETLGDLLTVSAGWLCQKPGIGPVAMREIAEDLEWRGLKLRDDEGGAKL